MNVAASLCRRVATASTRNAEFVSNASAVSYQIARGTAEWRQAHRTISTQSRELGRIVLLKKCIKSLEENVAFYKASEGSMNGELAAATAQSTRLGQLFDSVRADGGDLQEKLEARDAVLRSIIEYSCATLEPSFRALVENFCAGLNSSLSEACRTGYIDSQFHADNAINSSLSGFWEVLRWKMVLVPTSAKTLFITRLTTKSSNHR